jgi:hypothetical protein
MIAEVLPLVGDPLGEPNLARALTDRYLVFDAWVAGQRRVDLHPLVLSPSLHRKAVAAAEGAVRAVGAVTRRALSEGREANEYGFHPDTLRLARASHDAGDDAALMRVDLLLGDDGEVRTCEVNADCPGGHNEAAALPRLAREAGFLEGGNPTKVLDRLVDRLIELSRVGAGGGQPGAVGLIYATAYAEDLQVCALIKRALEQRGVEAILAPPTAPTMRDGALCIHRRPVRALYRFFPTEYMTGQRNLEAIERAVRGGVVRTLTSFSHVFSQSKLAYARAHATLGELPASVVADVKAYLPESHMLEQCGRERLVAERGEWVVKRALGRVGDQVFVGPTMSATDWGWVVGEALRRAREGERWIAQRFVRQAPVPTPSGPRYVTLGAYVLDGVFSGYFARLTPESHVSHEALVLPVFVGAER